MNWSLEFAPILPNWAIAAVAIPAAILCAVLLLQRSRGAWLRVLALALLIAAIANPHIRREEREKLSNIAVVVVDRSPSQKLGLREAHLKSAREALEKRLKAIDNLDVRWVVTDGQATDGTGGTKLFARLNEALTEIPAERIAGVVLLTDGRIHDVPARAEQLAVAAPVHALITGNKGERDRRLEILKAPRFGLVNETQTARIRVVETGIEPGLEPRTAKLKIQRENGETETREVVVGDEVDIPMLFPHSGLNVITLEVDAADGELTTVNNRALLAAKGVRQNLRVLLVSGEPHAGERTWRNLLKSDAAVDLVHFTILRPPEKQDGTPINQLSLIAFPTRELFSEKLHEFDLIIFDKYQRRGVLPLLYLDNVTRYVEDGGAVLIAAGDDFASPVSLYRSPLSAILPAVPSGQVIEKPYRPVLSDRGAKHPVTRALPGADKASPKWGRWFRLVSATKRSGTTLMNGLDGRPLLILDQRQKGRVALLLSDHAWLWSRGYDGGGPHIQLLRRLAHWLMKEPELEEERLLAKARDGNVEIERRSMGDSVEPVQVTTPDGRELSVPLSPDGEGRWRASIAADTPGLYRLTTGNLKAIAHLGNINDIEFKDVTATDEALKPLIEAKKGGVFWVGGRDAENAKLPRIAMMQSGRTMHGSGWIGLQDRNSSLLKGVRLTPIFAGLLALAVLLGVLSLTWFREGR